MIEKFLKLIGYQSDYIRENLTLERLSLNKEAKTLTALFHSAKPLIHQEMDRFTTAMDNANVQGISKLEYYFTSDSYDDEQVSEYYSYIVNHFSKHNLKYVSAADFARSYDSEAKMLSVNVPASDSAIVVSRKQIMNEFDKYGFKDVRIKFDIIDLDEKVRQEIEEAKKRVVEEHAEKYNEKPDYKMLVDGKELRGTRIALKELPDDEASFNDFKENQKTNTFILSGTIEFNDEESREKRGSAKLILKQDNSYVYLSRKIKSREEDLFFKEVSLGSSAEVQCWPQLQKNGDVYFSIVNMVVSTSGRSLTQRKDEEPKKRVELHVHTKMSALDGVGFISDYAEVARSWGQKAIACTDHGSVQSFHDLYEYTNKHPDIKPIYGVEFSFVNEDDIVIATEPQDIELSDATYTVFDLETTGFSVNYERIIEVSAVKVHKGVITGRFSELVNPEKPIHETVVELTGITNADVSKARSREEVLKDFREFIDGTILVGHNVNFDIGMLYHNFKELGIEFKKFPVIDTLILSRVLYPGHKSYSLDKVSKLLGVVLKTHHRALDDATATEEIFLRELEDLRKKGILFHSDINSIIDEKERFKLSNAPGHINLIAQTQEGLVNLYHIVSLANTEYFNKEPILTKKVLDEYREGILVGTGCYNSYFFKIAFEKDEEELERVIDYYDYIEVQPPSTFEWKKNHMNDWYYCYTDTIKKIISVAKKHGINVVATGDVHQINPEDLLYRKILVFTPPSGREFFHYLKGDLDKYDCIPNQYFMTTREMLDEFGFLGEQLSHEIVVTNSNLIADSCEFVKSFSNQALPPRDDFMRKYGIPSAEQHLKDCVDKRSHELYGDFLPGIVKDRIDHELKPILDNKFSTSYLISQQMVYKSRQDGYIVGSRGSVGSSFIAYLMDITEVNSLPPHYRCPKCKYSAFKYSDDQKRKYGIRPDEEAFQSILESVTSGFDLPDAKCPVCGSPLEKDGHDIPFETFLGVPEKPKTPDIDLNFSGENQGAIHNFIRDVFGETRAFRAGTILTAQSKVAYAMVRDYFFEKDKTTGEFLSKDGKYHSKAELEALAQGIAESKKSSSQHPGGIVVAPEGHEVYEITPVQYPGDSSDRSWMTTHFDYHTFEKNFFKLDVLGHDDPTVIRYLMKFVHAHPEEFPFKDAFEIPVNDPKVYELMHDTKVIGVQPNEIESEVATYGISEFGTSFVRGLVEEAKPSTFAELVKVSGLSHGTNVWNNNARDLVMGLNGQPKTKFKDIIGCRDDIMLDLINYGVPSAEAFTIMEFVRKDATKKPQEWENYAKELQGYGVPNWYLTSCSKIKYLFPKAHATAYVISALRIAWFKLYRPIYFYSALLSKKMTSFDIETMTGGIREIRDKLDKLKMIPQQVRKVKDDDLITTLELALEMSVRGLNIYGVNLYKSDAHDFVVSDDRSGLYMPFCAIDGMGDSAGESIIAARNEKPFTTKKDFAERTSVNKTVRDTMERLGIFKELQDDDQLTLDLGI